jgi:hypothetical protein
VNDVEAVSTWMEKYDLQVRSTSCALAPTLAELDRGVQAMLKKGLGIVRASSGKGTRRPSVLACCPRKAMKTVSALRKDRRLPSAVRCGGRAASSLVHQRCRLG